MLAGNECKLKRMMARLNMVSVNYNMKMKINTKRTKVLRVSKGSESDNEDSSCRGNYRTSQGILLLRKNDLRRCHRENKRRIATAASIWFEIWGVVDPGKKISISAGKFPTNFNFFRQFYKIISSFAGKFPKILIFFRQLKQFDFPSKTMSIYSYLWANYSISLQK